MVQISSTRASRLTGLPRRILVIRLATGARPLGIAPWIAVLAFALFGASCSPVQNEPDQPPGLRIDHEIRDLIASGGRGLGVPESVATGSEWDLLADVYRKRRHRPLWATGRHLRRQGEQLLEAIRRTGEAGLDPGDYALERLTRLETQAMRPAAPAERLRPRTLARFDVLATYSYLRAAEDLWRGRVPRAALDPDWARDSLIGGEPDLLRHSLGKDPSELFTRLQPRHPGYGRLRDALTRYRAIAEAGGWPLIPPGPPLKLGAQGPRVRSLVQRLAASGDFRPSRVDTVFDRRLEQAVGEFQSRLGIPRSGVLGEMTRAALNVPVKKRIRQMELNLERWRWLPDTLGRLHVEINVPAYRLELVRDGHVARAMRVVVGRRVSPTPIFSDRITYLEVNPTWTLPPSVVGKEIAPALKKNRDYLAENHMRVFSFAGARRDTVDPKDVPWKEADSDSFPYLIVQDAGPDNPLGSIKLMCPNEYDVYLHDTPLRSRFSVAVRDYSHGCVRVEHAIELADSLLGSAPGDTIRLDSLVVSGQWKRVRLPNPVPVHFFYWTAWADEAGHMCFRDDIYGLDERLDEALRRRQAAGFVVNPGVAISPYWAAAEAKARGGSGGPQAARASAKPASQRATAAAPEPRRE